MKKAGIITLIVTLSLGQLSAQQTWKADATASKIEWNGKKVLGEHYGIINLKEGWLSKKGDAITGGEFIVDMSTIVDTDIKDEGTRAKLEGHLRSDDFFGVAKYPLSKLVITGESKVTNGTVSLKGNLTIKDKTNPVSFTAKESVSGDMVTYTATIVVDRTLYDVRYGSGKFFDNLGDNAIYDDFTLTVKLVVKK
jgi:polyisoprenoid-binding protein YceI